MRHAILMCQCFLTLDTDVIVKNCNSNNFEVSSVSTKAQLHHETIDNDDRIASVEQLITLGHSYQVDGRNKEATESYEKAVQIALETDDNDVKTKAYQHLGTVYTATSEYKNAIVCFKRRVKYLQASKQMIWK